ncbi:MerR family transcriptional regulator [Alteromonadaceae bacterium BrNp21-10]|nr:MerR family transcriptional regulator [Alteromonadaceae bacterium BrNp21-10]
MNVSEFSKRVDLNPHTVRYYDKIGLIGHVHRLTNGHRTFSQKDVQWIEFVQRLKDTGMSLENILLYAKLREKGNTTLVERKAMLVSHSQELLSKISTQQQHLQKLNEKVDLYQSALEGLITLD